MSNHHLKKHFCNPIHYLYYRTVKSHTGLHVDEHDFVSILFWAILTFVVLMSKNHVMFVVI